jgi:hypothetical protein
LLSFFRWKTDIHHTGNGEVAKDVEKDYLGISNFRCIGEREKLCTEELQKVLWNNALKSPYRTVKIATIDKSSLNKDPRNINSPSHDTTDLSIAFGPGTELCKTVFLDMKKYIEELKTTEENSGKL